MLLVEFSIAVELEHFDEVIMKIDELGIEVQDCMEYGHPLHPENITKRIGCIAPFDRVKMLCDYLNNDVEYQTVLSY